MSEFINRCLRDDFNTNFNNLGNKKYKQDYRSSSDYQKTLKIVLKQLNKFLKISKHINDDFEWFDISKAYQAREENDFNDLIIADTITKNKLKLLTDDLDFQNSLGIDTQWYLK